MDTEIIDDILNGDKDLFSKIVEKYKDRIYRLCISHLKDPFPAEDVTQEIFIKIYKSLPTFKGKSSFSTWVYSIAYFTCIDKLRKTSKNRLVSLDHLMEKEKERFDIRDSDSFTDRIEDREIIKQVEERMPDKYMSILHLKITHNYSYREISEITGISINSVKGRLKRARKKFIKIYRHFNKDISTK